jgi:hypothetical protein
MDRMSCVNVSQFPAVEVAESKLAAGWRTGNRTGRIYIRFVCENRKATIHEPMPYEILIVVLQR